MTNPVVAGDVPSGNVVCDLDGVVYLEGREVPGAGHALRRLLGAGYHILFVTNNSSRPPASVAARISEITGRPVAPGLVIGSAEAAVTMLAGRGPVLVVGGEGITEALACAGIEQTRDPGLARAVVVGLDTSVTYDKLHEAAAALRRGARFVATNTDATYPTPSGPAPGAGAIVAALRAASGVEPEVAGKPHEPIRALIRSRLHPGPVWVVGDRPDTDLAMARVENWRSVLVLTGVTSDPGEIPERPDLVVGSLADLPEALGVG